MLVVPGDTAVTAKLTLTPVAVDPLPVPADPQPIVFPVTPPGLTPPEAAAASPEVPEEADRLAPPGDATGGVADEVLVAAFGGRVDGSLPPATPAASARLVYDVQGQAKGLSYHAHAKLDWRAEGSRYWADLEISAFLIGSRSQTSRGEIGPQGLMPLRFGDRRRGGERAVHFDHAHQRIRFSNNTPDAPLMAGAQDRLSVFLQLGALLQARPTAYPEGGQVRVQVAGTGGAEVWVFQVGPLQTLDLPSGAVSAVRLWRGPRRDHDSTVEIWLAPALQYLPVRVRVTEDDGAFADQVLRSTSALPETVGGNGTSPP